MRLSNTSIILHGCRMWTLGNSTLRRGRPRQLHTLLIPRQHISHRVRFRVTCHANSIQQVSYPLNCLPGGNTAGYRRYHSSHASLGEVDFKLADIGEGIAEVEILQWFVAPGDKIAEFDPVCEVQSDKATVEITSRYNGVVHSLNWEVGEMAKVGSALLKMTTEDAPAVSDNSDADTSPSEMPGKQEKEEKPPLSRTGSDPERSRRLMGTQGSFSIDPILTPLTDKSKQPREPPPPLFNASVDTASSGEASKIDGKHLTTPAVRRLARDHGLDLSAVTPTGKGGRVLKGDVLAHIAKKSQEPDVVDLSELAAASSGKVSSSGGNVEEKDKAMVKLEEDVTVPLGGIHKMMSKTMTKALEIPHFNLMEEYDMTNAVKFRKKLQETAAPEGVKISYMPILLKAVSLSLLHFPQLNAHVNSDVSATTYKADHNIGVAMDTPRGLLVPVIHKVQHKSMLELAEALADLQDKGQRNKLGEAELQGGTISLSNIGSIGGTYASPVLLSPQVAIGAIGRIRKVPKFDEQGNVQATSVINISWAADHRVVDGATMARFSNKVKSYLEDPMQFVAAMR